jgi:hypothetical protein
VAALGVPLVLLAAFSLKAALREEPTAIQPAVVRAPKVVVPASAVVPAGTMQSGDKVTKVGSTAQPSGVQKAPASKPKPLPEQPKRLTEKEKADLAAHHAASKLLGFARGDGEANIGKIALSCLQGTLMFVDGSQKGKLGSEEMVADVTAGKHVVIVILPNQKLFSQSVNVPAGKILKIRPSMCN